MAEEGSSVKSASDASVVIEGNANPADGVGGYTPPPTDTSAPAKTETKKVEYGEGDHTPLFPDEAKPSVEELTGPVDKPATEKETPAPSESKADKDKPTATPESGDTPPEKKKDAEEAPKADAEDKDKAAAPDKKAEGDAKTPPKGFVPTQALKEERRFRQEADGKIVNLTQEIGSLKAQLAGRKEGDAPIDVDNPFKDFEVLSADKLAELKDESTVDYVEYMAKKGEFDKWTEKQDEIIESNQAEASRIIGATMNTIESEIPGFYTNDALRESAAKFADEYGLPVDSLVIISNPATQLFDPNVEGTMIMGDIAADVMTFVNRTQSKIKELETRSPADTETLTEQITKKVRAELTEELAGHFKTASSEEDFRSLADVTQADSSTPDTKTPVFKPVGEDEMAKWTPEQRETYMRDGVVPA